MNGKIEFELKPVSGVAAGGGGYRAILTTAKGESVDIDGVITEARAHGYLMGIKDEAAKSVVLGVLDSMIAGVMRDGRTRRIGDYLSVSLKIRGRFSDKQDEFDPARHKLALSLKQLKGFRPSFKGVEATNVNHKRQFRVYSARTEGVADAHSGRLVIGRDFVLKGAEFHPEREGFGVAMHIVMPGGKENVGANPPVLAASDGEIRCAWPEELSDMRFAGYRGEVAVYRREQPDDPNSNDRRFIRIVVVQEPAT